HQSARMSGSEEQPCSSKNIPSTPRRSLQSDRRRRSKQKDPSIELNDEDKRKLLREYADTDQNLEKFAQAHNMTALNVKSVLRSLIKNHHALARVLGTNAPDDSIDGVRITRSKTKALQDSSNQGVDMTSNVPIKRGNTWVDLRFNEDDEYDNDYRPDEDDSEDEIGTDSSPHGTSDEDESEHLSEMDEDEDENEHNLTIVENNEDDSMNDEVLNSSDFPFQDRSESAASLTLNAMMGEDDEPSNDFDYKLFVDNLNMDNIPYDEDDEDPEFMVPTDDLFRDEIDDERTDFWSSTITLKEVEGLVEDIVPSHRYPELARNLSPPLRQTEATRHGATVEMRAVTATKTVVESERRVVALREHIFTAHHRKQLRAQFEQHVQLLTQSFVGCYFEPLLEEEKEKARKMIEGLNMTAHATSHLGKKSAFYISNLAFAVDTVNGMVDRRFARPIRPLAKEHLTIPRPILSVTKEVLCSSRAILYPHLVSQHRLTQSIGSCGWSHNEIILLAMALNRHEKEPINHRLPQQGRYCIIAENCMPWRTMNELRWQFNGLKRGLTRNGKTRHNREFFDVVEGNKKMMWTPPLRAKLGWTMIKWQKNALPPWYDFREMKRKSIEVIEIEKEDEPENKIMRKERRIEEGDDEMEAIVIVEDGGDEDEERREGEEGGEGGDEGGVAGDREEEIREEERGGEGGVEGEEEGGGGEKEQREEDMGNMETDEEESREKEKEDIEEREEIREKEKENIESYSLDEDECAMDSIEKGAIGRSPEEIEGVRGEESGRGDGDGLPIDFSHLMNEMSPSGPSTRRTPSPKLRSTTPDDKSYLPATPGKRLPSPTEESLPWMEMLKRDYSSPPRSQSPPANSRIKTPGGTMDYVDSLIGYFGTPEREEIEKGKKKEGGAETVKRSSAYSNLFGDFDFDESDGDEEMTSVNEKKLVVKKEKEKEKEEGGSLEGAESVVSTAIEDKPDTEFVSPEVPVKPRNKRTTRVEKEKRGLAAINDSSFRLRVITALAKKASDDIRSRMNMHISIFKQIQDIFSQSIDKKDRERMFTSMLPVLSSAHKEVLYLLSAFSPVSSLPRSLVLSQTRHSYVAAIHIMSIIYAYMSKIQRRISYRQLLKMIVEAHSKGGTENVLSALKEVLVNDPLLMRVLSEYTTPSSPSKNSSVWEVIDIRKGEEAFSIFNDNAGIERVDLCEVMGGVPNKKMILQQGKELSNLMINHDGEPILRNKDGKYKEITVMSDKQMEEEKVARAMEKEEEKKAKQREKTKERMKAVKKAKMMERREERAREKKKQKERIIEEEERKKGEKDAPPSLPFNRDMDKALLLMYNEVQRVTKRAVRRMNVDIPYSSNFTLEQLQARLDFLLSMAD
ncbi:hypothetical protein PENTCL1PPCAC_17576, partial [Pristionchus entomophagus]